MTERRARVLIVDDDVIVAESIAHYLAQIGYDTVWSTSGEQALRTLDDACRASIPSTGQPSSPQPFAVLIADMSMPDMNGFDLMREVRRQHPDIVPIIITGYGTIEAAVRAIRAGAIDYLTKPVVDDELRIAVEKAVNQHALLADNTNLRRQLDQRYGLDNLIGSDPRMRRVYDVIQAVAPSKTTVLMCGESGTGKSVIARAIHRNSPRKDRPFVEISCGSIPETLLESELFGHVKGAFTGAHANKAGRFLAAHTGTLFLDEINSASPGMQLKLLRVIQERTFEPVGSNEPIEVDVRVVLASNQPLEDLVASGQFRQDLYYRINVVMIQLPPLRERMSDIALLAEHFLAAKAADARKQVIGFTDEAMSALRGYSYPGNVRELENIVERAVVLTRHTRIGIEDLPDQVAGPESHAGGPGAIRGHSANRALPGAGASPPTKLHKALQEPEKQIILAALEANNWNRQKTARQLDINRTTLYKKIKQYRL
ncbi:MAG: sigma-54 dependent transcriptional regulator, partial [Phycisphaerales bacterium]|nr:sigma-54 dependent transcriptional regulator [Phycisphaerales bacterium]